MSTVRLHDALNSLIDRVNSGQWIQCHYKHEDRRCLSAMISELPTHHFDNHNLHTLQGRIRNIIMVTTGVRTVSSWNDFHAKCADDVVTLIEKIKSQWPDEVFTQGLTTPV